MIVRNARSNASSLSSVPSSRATCRKRSYCSLSEDLRLRLLWGVEVFSAFVMSALVLWRRPVIDEIIHNERKFPLEHFSISNLNPKLPNYGMMPPRAWMVATWRAKFAHKSFAHLVIWNHDG